MNLLIIQESKIGFRKPILDSFLILDCKMKKQIPNIITLSNLVCGTLAVWQASQGNLCFAALFIFAGAFFDFFDGMVARLLHVQSPMGKELDSLADVVTFGVAPGFIVFSILEQTSVGEYPEWMKFGALLIPAFSAYRLAKFNLDERQTSSFIGLPTPANALFWGAYGIIISAASSSKLMLFPLWNENITAGSFFENPYFIIGLTLLLSIALVAEIPLFALKFKNFAWKNNRVRYIFLISDIILLLWIGVFAIPIIILFYIILSLITAKHSEK